MSTYFTVHLHWPLEVGRESSLGIKELFNLPPRRLSGSALCMNVPEKSVSPQVLGLVVEDRPSDLLCMLDMRREQA